MKVLPSVDSGAEGEDSDLAIALIVFSGFSFILEVVVVGIFGGPALNL